MSKKRNPSLKIKKQWLNELNDKFLLLSEEKIKCTKCNKFVPCNQKSHLIQHIATKLHLAKTASCSEGEPSSSNENFCLELCEALVSANIPWNALSNEKLKAFLQKYTKRNIPGESCLRKTYLSKCYENKIMKIREDIGNNYMWMSVYETTNSAGRSIANLVVGKMQEDAPSTPHLIACEAISEVNSSAVAQFVNKNLRKVFIDGVENKVLLFLTDSASYMIAAGKQLKILFSKMIHVTCLAHGLHRLAETIRLSFPMVNKYVTAVKNIFLKAPSRVRLYKTTLNISLPPEPVLTRWGTWIKAVVFNATHFQGIKQVIEMLDEKDSESIKVAHNLLKQNELIEKLTLITNKFEKLPTIIKCLEARELPLSTSLKYMKDTKEIIDFVNGDLGEALKIKFSKILQRNVDFTSVQELNEKLKNADYIMADTFKIVGPHVFKFKYAPLTSVDVERSFSAYKTIFSEKRQNIIDENMEKLLVIYSNK